MGKFTTWVDNVISTAREFYLVDTTVEILDYQSKMKKLAARPGGRMGIRQGWVEDGHFNVLDSKI